MTLMDQIRDGYDNLALTQLEELKKDYEARLSEAKGRAETSKQEVVQKAVTSKIQEIRSEQEKLRGENKALREGNQSLINHIRLTQNEVEEIKKGKTMSLESKQKKIRHLKEEISDLEMHIKAQEQVAKTNDKDGIKEGTLMPVLLEPPTSAQKNRKKLGRRGKP